MDVAGVEALLSLHEIEAAARGGTVDASIRVVQEWILLHENWCRTGMFGCQRFAVLPVLLPRVLLASISTSLHLIVLCPQLR